MEVLGLDSLLQLRVQRRTSSSAAAVCGAAIVRNWSATMQLEGTHDLSAQFQTTLQVLVVRLTCSKSRCASMRVTLYRCDTWRICCCAIHVSLQPSAVKGRSIDVTRERITSKRRGCLQIYTRTRSGDKIIATEARWSARKGTDEVKTSDHLPF
jgi:hypothetical protein